jgi:hypothetical protein
MVERCNGREGRTEEKPQEATRIRARVQHRPLILNARDRDASRDLEIKDLLERESFVWDLEIIGIWRLLKLL